MNSYSSVPTTPHFRPLRCSFKVSQFLVEKRASSKFHFYIAK